MVTALSYTENRCMWRRDRITSSNIGKDKSFVDDLNREQGIVRMRVAFVPRSTEIQPSFCRFVFPDIWTCHSASPDSRITGCQVPFQYYDLGRSRRPPILIHDNIWESYLSPLSSMDSGLEAFSLNPTHGSFSALTFQSTEFANYVNQRFLSY